MTRKLTDRELSVSQISRETGLSRSTVFRRAVKYGDDSPLVGHAARLNSIPAKDHTGRVFPALRKMAEGASNIHFTGRLPREEVIRRMQEADVFAMVSHTLL